MSQRENLQQNEEEDDLEDEEIIRVEPRKESNLNKSAQSTRYQTKTSQLIRRRPKQFLQNVGSLRIPEHKLRNALRILQDDNDPLWIDKNQSCNISIHNYYNQEESAQPAAFNTRFARQCLLRRDWRNLAKTLTHAQIVGNRKQSYLHSMCARYASLCLAHNDKEMFMSYLKSIYANIDPSNAITTCTAYPRDDETFQKFNGS